MKPVLCINLIPVRELQRIGRTRAHRRVEAALAGVTLLALFALTWRTWETESELAARLRSIVTAGSVQDARAGLLRERLRAVRAELSLLEPLSRRDGPHRAVLRGVAEAVLDGIWLRRFEMTRETLTLEGHAKDDALIAQFLQRLAASPLLAAQQLTGAYRPKEAPDGTGTRFSTRARIASHDRETKDEPEAPE